MIRTFIKWDENELNVAKTAALAHKMSFSAFIRHCVAFYLAQETEERKEEISPTPPKGEKKEGKERAVLCTRAREGTPTFQEVEAYIREKGYTFSAMKFYALNQSRGWKVKGDPIESWKALCDTWHERNKERAAEKAERQAAARASRPFRGGIFEATAERITGHDKPFFD